MTRTAWVKRALAAALDLTKAELGPIQFGDADYTERIVLRFNRRELRALDLASDAMGIRRSDLVRKMVRSRLYEGEGAMVPNPEVKLAIQRVVVAIDRVGVNLNQAVAAIHTAVGKEEHAGLAKAVRRFNGRTDGLVEAVQEAQRAISHALAEEQTYWCGTNADRSPRKEWKLRGYDDGNVAVIEVDDDDIFGGYSAEEAGAD